MDGISQAMLLMALAVGVGTYSMFVRILGAKQDPQEPPLVPATIPYIDHVIGIMRSKFNYYVQLSHQSVLPMFTMTMPGTKVQAIQKQPKELAFPPIEAKFASRICGSSAEAHKILMTNVNGDEGDWGLSMESYAAM